MSGLVGWWPLHESKGRATDLSGNGYHGTIETSVDYNVAGRGGLSAYGLSKDSRAVNVSSIPIDNTDDVSITFWIRPNSPADGDQQRIIDFRDSMQILLAFNRDSTAGGYDLWVDNDIGQFGSAIANEWQHGVLTYEESSDTFEFYLNGSSLGTLTASMGSGGYSNIISGNANLSNSTGFAINGAMCDFRLYNRVLSQSEIQTLYEWGSGDYANPRDDGVAYYPLDGDATDAWGTNDGTSNGGTFSSTSIRGQSCDFSGDGDITVADDSSISFTEAFSVSFWAKTDSLSDNDTWFRKWSSGTGYWARYSNTNNGLTIFIGDGSSTDEIQSSSSIQNGSWSHFAYIHDGTNMNIYINGALDTSQPCRLPNNNSSPLYLGDDATTSGRNIDGKLDDIRFYDYGLEPHEVFELYQWGTFGRDMRKFLVNR